MSESERLLFYFFNYKTKETAEQKSKRIQNSFKKKPDFILSKID